MRDLPTISSPNWNRGAFRLWLTISAAWIMGWALYSAIYVLQDGFWKAAAIQIPVALCGPPAALYLVGIGAKWAIKGFAPSTENDLPK
jgi:hypothetical protein